MLISVNIPRRTRNYENHSGDHGNRVEQQPGRRSSITAIMQGDTTVDLEEQGCYETAKIRAEDAALVKACDTMNKWVSAQITYDWNGQ